MGDVSSMVGARTSKTQPQKNAGASTTTTVSDFQSDDDVVALTALRDRAAEMLAKPDILERDFKSVSLEYRAVRAALQEAKDLVKSHELGKRGGLKAVGSRSLDGDI
jgi:hypothetical protein